MQDELFLLGLPVDVRVIGVNEVGHESGNATVTALGNVPWLQETAAELVWAPWNVTYRDVIIVDEENIVVDVFNLTGNDLGDSANYDELLALFVSAAGG